MGIFSNLKSTGVDLTKVANEVEIEKLPNDVKEKLQIKKESFWNCTQTRITIIIGTLVASIISAMLGNKIIYFI